MKRLITTIILFILFAASVYCGSPYKGGEFRTKEAYAYGRFEVNYKTAKGDGILSTYFTYFDGTDSDPWSSTKWNEIDLEILGRFDDNVQFNTITPGQTNHVRSQYVSFDPSKDYHTYAVEWTPDYVAWFVDGAEVYRQTQSHIQTLTRPQKIMMNIWQPVYASWVGTFDPSILPVFAYYDWTSYYAYTPGAGNYGTDNNFTHSWTDNFDSWDQNRWEKASHTFQGNNVDFIPANIVFNNGKMILCLTDDVNTGYQDLTKPTARFAKYADNKIEIMFSEEIEKSTAETLANYVLSGVTINSATQQEDKRKVVLDLSGYDTSKANSIIVRNVKDSSGNSMTAKILTVSNVNKLVFPVKINVGGNAWQGYLADQVWDDKAEYGYCDGTDSVYTASIANTEDDPVYQAVRFGLVEYKVRVPDGTYNVKLLFSEPLASRSTERVFDIYVEDSLHTALNVDIFKFAGKNKAKDLKFLNVTVKDGILNIDFMAEVGASPILNGIVIEDVTTGVNSEDIKVPVNMTLEQNYPNPFNATTTIKYSVAQEDFLSFYVYDILGSVVYQKNIGEKPAGKYELVWNAVNNSGQAVGSGVYIYRLKGNYRDISKKLVLLY